ncbi:MAG: hypothetical protein QM817_40170 [Archangium sp.]
MVRYHSDAALGSEWRMHWGWLASIGVAAFSLAFKAGFRASEKRSFDLVFFLALVATLFDLFWLQTTFVRVAVETGRASFDVRRATFAVWSAVWVLAFARALLEESGTRPYVLALRLVTLVGAVGGVVALGASFSDAFTFEAWLVGAKVALVVVAMVLLTFGAVAYRQNTRDQPLVAASPQFGPAILSLCLGVSCAIVGVRAALDSQQRASWAWQEPIELDHFDSARAWTLGSTSSCSAPKEDLVWIAQLSDVEVRVAGGSAKSPDQLRSLLTEASSLMKELERPLPPLVLVAERSAHPSRDMLDVLVEGRSDIYLMAPQQRGLGSHLISASVWRGCVCRIDRESDWSTGQDWGATVARLWRCN